MKDNRGREVTTLYEVRSAVVTAQASLLSGSPVTLLTGDSDYFLDLVEITFACNSTVALGGLLSGLDLRNDGSLIRRIDLPESGMVQLKFPIPLMQQTKNTPWILDMDDITGVDVEVGATFIKNTNKPVQILDSS